MKDINSGTVPSFPNWLKAYQQKLYFSASDSGVFGYNLWVSDGTVAGTLKLTNSSDNSNIYRPSLGVSFAGYLYFPSGHGLYRTDGTLAGTQLVAPMLDMYDSMIKFNGQLFFASSNSDFTAIDIFAHNGNIGNVSQLGQIAGDLNRFKVVQDTLLAFINETEDTPPEGENALYKIEVNW